MSRKSKKQLSPAMKSLLIFSGGFALSIAACVAVVILGIQLLSNEAKDVNKTLVEKEKSELAVSTIRAMSEQMKKEQAIVDRAKRIAGQSEQYLYQDATVERVKLLAKKAGVEISKIDFEGSGNASGGQGASAAAAPAPTEASVAANEQANASGGAKPAQSSTTKVNSVGINVSLSSPMPYARLLEFVNLIETSPTRMQIKQLDVSADASDNSSSSNLVRCDSISIELYTR